MEWESGFHPDEVRVVSCGPQGKPGRFRLTDGNGKSATIDAPSGVEPAIEQGKLVIRVGLSEPKSAELGELTGQVLDEQGRPVAGARVGLGFAWDLREGARASSRDARHWTTSDPQGRFHIGSIPRRYADGNPMNLQVVVAKDGFARANSESFVFEPGEKAVLRSSPPFGSIAA